MRRELILGLHPSVRGFGWALVETPGQLLDWGVARHRNRRNAKCKRAIERLLRQHRPNLVVIEDWRERHRSKRVTALYEQILTLCEDNTVPCRKMTPAAIRKALSLKPNADRHEVATFVAKSFDAIALRLPKRRAAWDGEHPNMALFNAIAAVLARLASRAAPSSSPVHPEAPA